MFFAKGNWPSCTRVEEGALRCHNLPVKYETRMIGGGGNDYVGDVCEGSGLDGGCLVLEEGRHGRCGHLGSCTRHGRRRESMVVMVVMDDGWEEVRLISTRTNATPQISLCGDQHSRTSPKIGS